MKRTKIVCTLGPASSSRAMLEKLIKNGMNVARLNFSHGDYSEHKQLIKNVRQAASNQKANIAILQDLQGPRIRVGDVGKDGVKISKGGKVALVSERLFTFKKKIKDHAVVPIQYQKLYKDVKKGAIVLIEDGKIQLKITSIEKEIIKCISQVSGVVKTHKGINVPGVLITADVITNKDKHDVEFGVKQGVDYVAISFVKSGEDIKQLRKIINQLAQKSKRTAPGIIAKIERQEALDNFEGILREVDGIMVARGDLGLEIPASKVPIWQKNMILSCLALAKPVIVATQMLDSMVDNIQPTRAEVSDVANAVIDHTDAVMLSAESAIGKYPAETVKMMTKTIQQAEDSVYDDLYNSEILAHDNDQDHVIWAATYLAYMMDSKVIMTINTKINNARYIARYRPEVTIATLVHDDSLKRKLALFWGIKALVVPRYTSISKYINKGVELLKKEKIVKKGDKIIFVAGTNAEVEVMKQVQVITV